MGRRTVADAYGPEIADRLALLAIDLLCGAPETISTAMTRVPAALVSEGREILDDAGVDWRLLIRDRIARQAEAEDQRLAARWATQAKKRDTDYLERLLGRLPAQAVAQRAAVEAELRRRETFQ